LILFGTGGVRGKMRPGEFDEKLVLKVTQAVSDWMKDEGKRSVVVAYDTRRKSRDFARLASFKFKENGMDVFLFKEPVPTPLLSFAVRYMEADAGIVMTASHNPPEYNGYKVYNEEGVQILPETADKIRSHMEKLGAVEKFSEYELNIVPDDVIESYLERVEKLVEPLISKPLGIVYSPLHGTGLKMVSEALKRVGVNAILVKEQTSWDGSFSTVRVPNPEEDDALELVKKYMDREGIPYGIATDPDCDRVGSIVKEGEKFVKLTGNQIGVLLLHYMSWKMEDWLKKQKKPYVVKTIVTTDMVRPMCDKRGIHLFETPTGFKFIGDVIVREEKKGNNGFLLAFEESYGFLAGNFVKDKDGVIASCLIAGLLSEEENPLSLLNELYRRYGFYMEKLLGIELSSVEKAQEIYRYLKEYTPSTFGKLAIRDIADFSKGINHVRPNETLKLIFDEGTIYVRPSGTEPKLKFYLHVSEETKEKAVKCLKLLENSVEEFLNNFQSN